MSNRVTKQCRYCAKDFSIPQCRDFRDHFCSPSCGVEFRAAIKASRKRECAICGSAFYPRQIQLTNGHGRYCSIKCSTKATEDARKTPEATAKRVAAWKANPNRRRLVGPDNPRWNGGRSVQAQGYMTVRVAANTNRLEHRVVMERVLGRPLRPDEIVHHKNHDKADNRPENLELMTRAEHFLEHLPSLLAGRGL